MRFQFAWGDSLLPGASIHLQSVFDKYSGFDKVWVAVCHREHFSISGNKGRPGNNCNKAKTIGTPGVIGQPRLLCVVWLFLGLPMIPIYLDVLLRIERLASKYYGAPGQICFNDRRIYNSPTRKGLPIRQLVRFSLSLPRPSINTTCLLFTPRFLSDQSNSSFDVDCNFKLITLQANNK